MTPTVSVVIPTYNRAALVRQAVQSVLDQSYTDFEVIVIDDGSTDNTGELIDGIDSRVRYIRRENHGRSAARNFGLSLVRGRYIAFLDSDDMFLPHKLERQLALLEADPTCGMVYASATVIDETCRPTGVTYRASVEGSIYSSVAFFVPVTVCLPSVVLRAEVLQQVGGFDERMHRFEDTDMWRRVSRRVRVRATREPLVLVRTHSGNQMEDPAIVLAAIDFHVHKAFAEDREVGEQLLRRCAARLYRHYGYAVRRHPQWSGRQGPFFERAFAQQRSIHQLECWLYDAFPRLHRVLWNAAAGIVRTGRRIARLAR